MCGFEPDRFECECLNNLYSKDKSLRFHNIDFFPVTLGKNSKKSTLYITQQILPYTNS